MKAFIFITTLSLVTLGCAQKKSKPAPTPAKTTQGTVPDTTTPITQTPPAQQPAPLVATGIICKSEGLFGRNAVEARYDRASGNVSFTKEGQTES
jgi:hypothetical protein